MTGVEKMEQCSETSAYKTQTPGNYPEESIQHSEHDERLKSRMKHVISLTVSTHNTARIVEKRYQDRQPNVREHCQGNLVYLFQGVLEQPDN